MKIVIIGYSGSGKSTLAAKLGKHYNIPVLHLDKVHWLPGWQERKREDEQAIVTEFLDNNDSWIIDGTYTKLSYERRMNEADKIIILNFNRFTCLIRAFKRKKAYKNKTRDSITEGCEERINKEFFWWLIYKGRVKKKRRAMLKPAKQYPSKTIILKNQRQINKFEKECGM